MLKVMMMTMMMMLIKMMNNSNLFVECTLSKNIFVQQQVWFVQHTTMSSIAYCCFACNELLFDIDITYLMSMSTCFGTFTPRANLQPTKS